MEPTSASSSPLAALSNRVLRQLLTIGENRIELLTVELCEERDRLLQAILVALAVAVLGLLAGITLTAAIVVLCWEHAPLAALLTLTALYAAAGIGLAWRLASQLRHWQTFSASIEQIRKDRAALDTFLS